MNLLSKGIQRELESNIMYIHNGSLLSNLVKVIRNDLGLLHKNVTGVVFFPPRV